MIEIKNAAFKYDEREDNGVRDINLNIEKGQCVVLCGKSGCGKTTITRMINGLVPHFYSGIENGTVKLDKVDIKDIPMYKISQKVGSVFQNPRTQFFNIDTDSEIAFGMENLAYPIEKLKANMNKTVQDMRIRHLLGRSIFELSGGEKQKIAFALIYAMSPEVYVLDEPSSNLDMDAIEELKNIIQFLKNQGKTIIVAEHRTYFLKDIADYYVYMDKGAIKDIYNKEEFEELDEDIRREMGLRTIDLSNITIDKTNKLKDNFILQVNDLNIYYKKKEILNDINLKASSGEVIGIIGHNGAGKSTFLKTLCGLNKNYTGSIKWKGSEVNCKKRIKLSYMVMQDVNYQLFAESVQKECTLGIKNVSNEVIDETLKKLKLYEYKDRHPNTLSGGQKQRTAVAVSMICNKEIIIFDEPTSGLDYDSMVQVSNMILKLAESGKVIFVVTHDYEFISLACSRIIHFDNKQKCEDYPIDSSNSEKLKEFFVK